VEVEREQDEPEPAELDPETRERRDAARAHVRTLGTGASARARLRFERFADALRIEVQRMGELMHDALGLGLAATQLGVLHRVWSTAHYPEDRWTALVNPLVDGVQRTDDLEAARRGCMSLPE